LDGGWSVDALLGQQTRFHKDLDITMQQKDPDVLCGIFKTSGYKEINQHIARPHNFVMANACNREIDVHVIVLNEKGDGIYGPVENGEVYPEASLSGKGKLGNMEVNCISAEYVVKFHTGYALKEKDHKDVLAICRKFNLEIAGEYL
jgi:lincosamide nucleotidyltransferase A/C/D/E